MARSGEYIVPQESKDAPAPRPEEKRRREKPKQLTKRELERINEVELDEILLTVDERACAHLCAEYNKEHAAVTLGWPLEAVEECLALPHVRLYLQKADEAFLKEIAKAKVRRFTKINVTVAAVEQRAMELAMLPPSETKGTIDGQVKALNLLAKVLGMLKDDDPLKGKSRSDLEGFIRSAARMLPAAPAGDPNSAPAAQRDEMSSPLD